MSPEPETDAGLERSGAARPPAATAAGNGSPAGLVSAAAATQPALGSAPIGYDTGQALESRMAFLARSSMLLGTSLDSAATVESVARVAVPDLADACIIDLLSGGGTSRRAAAVHADPRQESRLQVLLGGTVLPPTTPQALALATGQAQIGLVERGEPGPWPASTDEGRLMAELGITAYLVLPLRSRGQTLGAMSLLSSRRRACDAEQFATAGEFVRRASAALDNALLYEDAIRARAAAESAQQQFSVLFNELRESEARYRTLFEESRDAIYMSDVDGRFLDVNPAALELFGYQREEMLRMNARQFYVDPDARDRFRADMEGNGSVRDYELLLRTRSGAVLDCLLSAIVRRGSDGRILGYQGIIHDITERKSAEIRLAESEHFTRTIIASVQQGIIVCDSTLRYQVWNRFMEELTGLAAGDVLDRDALVVMPGFREHGVDELLERALGGETVQSADLPFAIPSTGRAGWISCVYSPHVSHTGQVMGVVGIVHDITERKRAEDQLIHNAFHDALTGLPNRALFLDRLERLLRHSERHSDYVFGVAFLDLDRFKVVNDSLGHLLGDELLVALARRLETCVRQGDTVARLGGDEFAVLLDGVHDVRDATRVAERILSDLGRPFHLGSHDVYTMASIGIALSSTGYERAEEILRDADTAMYRAKLGGRSRYEVFDRNMHDHAVQTLQVEMDLRRSLERREFLLHYQPIISLDTGRIIGFEALLRWAHPTRGLVAPDEFVPLAEETGLIVGIGWWVLEEACTQLRRWHQRFPDNPGLSMAVNLSPKQFGHPDLLQQLDAILGRTGVPATCLKLEITEHAVLQHESTVTSTMNALRERGIQICIDDFGTGYSSLSYLHSFPVDTLKIDRSFVAQIGGAEATPRLVETIIALGRNLGMETVAEGVETVAQLEFLRTLGPRFAQGFFFSRPLDAAGAEAVLAEDPTW
jgi:diguanylate cyclase (GGDEF)-like protein/PAS domain S-box-containing protein